MSQSYPAGEGLPFYNVSQQCRREKPPPLPPPFLHSSFSFPYSSSYIPYEGYNLLEQNYYDNSVVQSQPGHGVSLSLSSYHPPQEQLLGSAAKLEIVPAGPFTGYAAILRGSRFLQPAQQILEEVCGGGSAAGLVGNARNEIEQLDFGADSFAEFDRDMDDTVSVEQRRMKICLIALLEEVCRKYRLYFQQIQSVITSFEAVAGLSTASPYTPLAVKTLSKHFSSLKDAITSQLRFISEPGRDDVLGPNRFMPGGSGSANQQHAWRPQRGLPERAVVVLRAWLFEHFLHPYPSDMDKQILAKQTGLSRNQVSNWFINARVRLWKPMVEEIHSLEQRRRDSGMDEDDDDADDDKQLDPSSSSPANDQTQQPSSSSPKRNMHRQYQGELAGNSVVDFSLDPMAIVPSGGHAGVSLTLGLHQNNGYCLPEQLPINVARRFGLEDGNMSFVMGGYEGQERQFGKEYDGQLLRDFVA